MGLAQITVNTQLEAARIAGNMAGELNGVWQVNQDCTVYIVSKSTHPDDVRKSARYATITVAER